MKKRKVQQLSGVKLRAFQEEPDSDEEPDIVLMATELKERGKEAASNGDFAEARSLLGRAVRLMPGSADLHEAHSQVLLELGRTWEAVRAAGRAVELRPQWAEAHLALARAQLNLGEVR
ncbi:hypothetical protein GPECTOR_2g1543 [Gonium pectorale]|uniref:Uncharacterized protein n=1 Tax=Gonium pectorale TaxID=33097 RepID=A0A150H1N0_GONPE|nr:hypothetical protein GPECTOR_2g1543 [Gonium pectorale]|eukprot:KXZ55991.1 hypothetical protein GPECTOR_2g1543 [Gonium pectorale]